MRILVALLALPCFGMGTCGPVEPPPLDDCSDPGLEPLTSIALGPERLEDRPFEPWAASDTAYITSGSQGGEMLGVALELGGGGLPSCLAQRTEVRQDGEVLAVEDVSIKTYEAGDGKRTTNTLWLIFGDGVYPALGSQLDVTSEAGESSASAHLTVVQNRHRMVSLTPVSPTYRVGEVVEFTLESVHAPIGSLFEVGLATTDTEVLRLRMDKATAFSESELLWGEAKAPGIAELVVTWGGQELRAAVTVVE